MYPLLLVLIANTLIFISNVSCEAAPKERAITPTPKTLNGQIIFLRGNDVWRVDPDKRVEQLIFKNPFWEGYWEPYTRELIFNSNSERIIFTHETKDYETRQHTGNELLSMKLNRTDKIRLTNTDWDKYSIHPRLSPDGKQIVYTRRTGYRMGGPGYTSMEIRIVNADGANDHLVIGDIEDLTQSYSDAYWSRDGKRLMFTHWLGNIDYEGEGRLQTCLLDGRDVQPFDGDYGAFIRPDVSPDGKFRVVIEPANPDFSRYADLRLFTAQGKFVRNLISSKPDLWEINPQWSQNGQRVIFQCAQIYTDIDKDGLAYQKRIEGVWMIDKDGNNLSRIAKDAVLIANLS